MHIPTFQRITMYYTCTIRSIKSTAIIKFFLLTFNFVLNAEILLKTEFSCCLSSSPFTLKDWCPYVQCNMDHLAMFALCVMSARDKFSIPLHWLYICD